MEQKMLDIMIIGTTVVDETIPKFCFERKLRSSSSIDLSSIASLNFANVRNIELIRLVSSCV